jgi:hypothetical protein
MISTFLASGKVVDRSELTQAKGSGMASVTLNLLLTDCYSNASGNHIYNHPVRLWVGGGLAVLANTLKTNDEVIIELKMTTREWKEKHYIDLRLVNFVMVNGQPMIVSDEVIAGKEKEDKQNNLPMLNEEAPF